MSTFSDENDNDVNRCGIEQLFSLQLQTEKINGLPLDIREKGLHIT